jgi:hypothetical protein
VDWAGDGFEDLARMRAVPTSVNRHPAVAFHHNDRFPPLDPPDRLPR